MAIRFGERILAEGKGLLLKIDAKQSFHIGI